MSTLSATLSLRLAASYISGNQFGGRFDPILAKTFTLTSGTGANQGDILYLTERTVADGANDDLDLSGTSLQDIFGTNIAMAEIVGLFVLNRAVNDTANTTTLSIGGGSNPFFGFFGATGDIIKCPPGGAVWLYAPDASGFGAVTGGSADILRIANSAGAAATYQIGIIGRSA